jgi:hypothetical protein
MLLASKRQFPPAIGLLVSVFPVFALTFALIAWAIRYFAGLFGQAAR